MFNAGIDNDDIVGCYGDRLAAQLQTAAAAGDKEKFCTRMGVWGGMPFGAVSGNADIQQFGNGTVHWVDGQRIENIVAGTHGSADLL